MAKVAVLTDEAYEQIKSSVPQGLIETIEPTSNLDAKLESAEGMQFRAKVWNGVQKAHEREGTTFSSSG